MLSADWITGSSLDGSLARDWNDLVDLCPSGTVFQRFEWLSEWWRARTGRSELAVLLVRRDGVLIGVAPLFISASGCWKYLRLMGEVNSDYCDVLFHPKHEKLVWGKMAYEIEAFCKCRKIHGLIASDVPSEHIRQYLDGLGLRTRKLGSTPCPYTPLPGNWDEFVAGLGTKNRQEIPRYYRRLEKNHQVCYESSHLDESSREQALDSLFELHTRYWQRRGEAGGFPPELQGFHRRVAAMSDGLRLYSIRMDGVIRAVFYGYYYKNKMWAYLTGVDPDFTQDHLGTLIFGLAIRRTIEEGGSEFDFTRGDELYKSQTWKALRDRENLSFVIPFSLRSRAAMLLSDGVSIPDLGSRSLVRMLRKRISRR